MAADEATSTPCPRCGTLNEPGASFCAVCGQPLGEPAASSGGEPPSTWSAQSAYPQPAYAAIAMGHRHVVLAITLVLTMFVALASLAMSAFLISRPSVTSVCDGAGVWSVAPKTRDLPAGWSLDSLNMDSPYDWNVSLTGPAQLDAYVNAVCINGSPSDFFRVAVEQYQTQTSASEVSMGGAGDESRAYRTGDSSSPTFNVIWRRGSIVASLSAYGYSDTAATTPISIDEVQSLVQAFDLVFSR